MTTDTCGTFTITYDMSTVAEPDCDIQFGMNFKLTQRNNKSLCQLIFPATSVGNNIAGQWNIDNHAEGNDPASLIYNGAEDGVINDTPKEISRPGEGVKTTKFAVYIVDIEDAVVYETGVKFGYKINTSIDDCETQFTGFEQSKLTNEQKNLIKERCEYIKFM